MEGRMAVLRLIGNCYVTVTVFFCIYIPYLLLNNYTIKIKTVTVTKLLQRGG